MEIHLKYVPILYTAMIHTGAHVLMFDVIDSEESGSPSRHNITNKISSHHQLMWYPIHYHP